MQFLINLFPLSLDTDQAPTIFFDSEGAASNKGGVLPTGAFVCAW